MESCRLHSSAFRGIAVFGRLWVPQASVELVYKPVNSALAGIIDIKCCGEACENWVEVSNVAVKHKCKKLTSAAALLVVLSIQAV